MWIILTLINVRGGTHDLFLLFRSNAQTHKFGMVTLNGDDDDFVATITC